MGIAYHHVQRFVGKPIIADCVGGRRYYGIVERVTPDTVYLRPIPYGVTPVSGNQPVEVTTADQNQADQPVIYETGGYPYGYGYRPYYPNPYYYNSVVALSLFAILAVSLFWW